MAEDPWSPPIFCSLVFTEECYKWSENNFNRLLWEIFNLSSRFISKPIFANYNLI